MHLRRKMALLLRLATPRRAVNALRWWWGQRRRPPVPRYLPLALDVEPTVSCNLRCDMCQTVTWSRKQPDLTAEGLAWLLDRLPGAVKVKLQGMGEPLLAREFPEMVAEARRRGLYVQTTTNGTLLGKDRGRRLLESGIDQVLVSIDGATDETFRRIRQGAELEQVLGAVRQFLAWRGSARTPLVQVWCVAQKANAAEIPDLVRLVHSLGADGLTVQHDLATWGKEEFTRRLEERRITRDLEPHLEEAARVAREVGLPFAIHHANQFDAAAGERCPWPWHSCYVTVEGKIAPCCVVSDPDLAALGDLREQSFPEIWRGPAYRAFRQAHEALDPPPHCRACYRNLPH